jgi:hypothetical protein
MQYVRHGGARPSHSINPSHNSHYFRPHRCMYVRGSWRDNYLSKVGAWPMTDHPPLFIEDKGGCTPRWHMRCATVQGITHPRAIHFVFVQVAFLMMYINVSAGRRMPLSKSTLNDACFSLFVSDKCALSCFR